MIRLVRHREKIEIMKKPSMLFCKPELSLNQIKQMCGIEAFGRGKGRESIREIVGCEDSDRHISQEVKQINVGC
jgi:hypothetical protein